MKKQEIKFHIKAEITTEVVGDLTEEQARELAKEQVCGLVKNCHLLLEASRIALDALEGQLGHEDDETASQAIESLRRAITAAEGGGQ